MIYLWRLLLIFLMTGLAVATVASWREIDVPIMFGLLLAFTAFFALLNWN
jgi:hypothetical protein